MIWFLVGVLVGVLGWNWFGNIALNATLGKDERLRRFMTTMKTDQLEKLRKAAERELGRR